MGVLPSVLLLLHSLQEEFANDVSGAVLLCAVLLVDNLLQLVLIPVLHAFLLILPPVSTGRCTSHLLTQQQKGANQASDMARRG